MDKLKAVSACAGLLPIEIGSMRVEETDVGPITSVSPFNGVSEGALSGALGMDFPAPLCTSQAGDARCVWVGQGEALLMGTSPAPSLSECAAVVDQTDAWAVVTLTGAGGADVLARLAPVDMRLSKFAVGATIRTHLGHMNASYTRIAEDAVMIAVFRSMARTLVHDLEQALEAVAARG